MEDHPDALKNKRPRVDPQAQQLQRDRPIRGSLADATNCPQRPLLPQCPPTLPSSPRPPPPPSICRPPPPPRRLPTPPSPVHPPLVLPRSPARRPASLPPILPPNREQPPSPRRPAPRAAPLRRSAKERWLPPWAADRNYVA